MSQVEALKQKFKELDSLDSVKAFLDLRAKKHSNYYHYTTINALQSMLQSKKLHLSQGKTMNDLLEIKKIASETWDRLYVASFSFSTNESAALWHIYGNPLNQAICIRFSPSAIRNVLAQLKASGQCQAVNTTQTYNIDYAKNVDVAYIQNNQTSLRWNRATLSESSCHDLPSINTKSELVGYIKNIAWEYEQETRILVELKRNSREDKFPDKIQIDAEALWSGVKILCGPCLDYKKFEDEMQKFYESNPSAIRLKLEYGKNLADSILLNRVYFKTKCEHCTTSNQCELLKRIEANHA